MRKECLDIKWGYYNDSYDVFKIIQKAEQDGLLCIIGSLKERVRTDLNEKMRNYFRDNYKLNGYYEAQEGEVILDRLTSYIMNIGINEVVEYPHSQGENDYLIPITDNLMLHVNTFDEYCCSGEYLKGVQIDRFLINEKCKTEDVDVLINVLKSILLNN